MMDRRGSLFVLSAPSGTGKSTLIRLLMEKERRLSFSISHTTRAPRRGETDGVHYHFVPREEFERMAESGEFVEWATVHGNLYGTSAGEIEKSLSAGNDVILDIDVQGAVQVGFKFPEAVLVFVLPPSMAELERRLRDRAKDDEEVIRRRLRNARDEIKVIERYHYVIMNDDVDRAVEELGTIIRAGRLRTVVRHDLVNAWSGS